MNVRYQWQLEPVRDFIDDLIQQERLDDATSILALLKKLDRDGPLNPVIAKVNGWNIRTRSNELDDWGFVYASKGRTITILAIFEDTDPAARNTAVEQAQIALDSKAESTLLASIAYIHKLGIEHIRGFQDGDLAVHLDFRRPDETFAGWTVLVGGNGAGKTTVLQAIALAVLGNHLQERWDGWLHHDQLNGQVSVDIEAITGTETYKTCLTRRRRKVTAQHTSSQPTERFMVGYGASRRLSSSSPGVPPLMWKETPCSRFVTLFREDALLAANLQWLHEIDLQRQEDKPEAKELVEGLLHLLQDDLLPAGIQVESVDSDGLRILHHDKLMPLTQLSDGVQRVIALVLDIVRHLHYTFGKFRIEPSSTGHWVVPYGGIVLIDDVDTYLHVSWQQRIGFWFKTHFPHMQFIVTTHSPFICQAADRHGLIHLPDLQEHRAAAHVSDDVYYTVVNGTADEAVMTELFGLEYAHSPRAEGIHQRLAALEFRMMRGTISEEERDELGHLAEQLPRTGSVAVERAVRKLRGA